MIYNMVGRGGGGASVKDTDALLRVSAPTGSSITVSRGATTLAPSFYTVGAVNDAFYFIIGPSDFDANPWTVTATRGSGATAETATDTIVVNSAGEHNKDLLYDLVLLDFSAMTFAEMQAQFRNEGSSGQSYIEDPHYIILNSKSTGWSSRKWALIKEIPLDSVRYNTLHFKGYAASGSTVTVGLTVNPVDTTADVVSSTFSASQTLGTTDAEVSIDISSFSKVIHALIQIPSDNNYNRRGYFSKIWATQG